MITHQTDKQIQEGKQLWLLGEMFFFFLFNLKEKLLLQLWMKCCKDGHQIFKKMLSSPCFEKIGCLSLQRIHNIYPNKCASTGNASLPICDETVQNIIEKKLKHSKIREELTKVKVTSETQNYIVENGRYMQSVCIYTIVHWVTKTLSYDERREKKEGSCEKFHGHKANRLMRGILWVTT